MAQELRVDPDALIRLADACLTAADGAGSRYRTGFRDLSLPADAFGNTPASAGPARVAGRLETEAQDAVYAHVQILESDADRLLQAAFAYRDADRLASQRMGGSRRAPL
ncbi:hypothetical protein ABT297_03675 [Dactylosporangium sp. NPDC000555]|uniref:hypothetical protein n=1 Tax=Dactylosporangium sp. NPDC000555 TaxID=3154260 RepID=UPI00331FE402